MKTREVTVKGRSVASNGDTRLVRTSVGIDQMHVLFDNAEWLDFPVKASFSNGDELVTVNLTLTSVTSTEWAAEATCTIPWEVIQEIGPIEVTFQGTDGTTGNHIITEVSGSPLTVVQEGEVDEGSLPNPNPTPQPVPATTSALGAVKPDGTTITIDSSGTISVGTVSSANLPSYVDDVIEGYYSNGAFYEESAHTTAITGETGKIYVDLSTDSSYRWSGTAFVSISNPIDLATQAEAEAGSENTKMMTALRVKQALEAQMVAITDSEIHTITAQSGYSNGDEVSY